MFRHHILSRSFAILQFSLLLLAASACSTLPPEGVQVVGNFDVSRYQGKWYEIARLDHSFERGLNDVSATYTVLPDGGVRVINRGYNPDRGGWKEAEGYAKFVGDMNRGSLKVSFFGPFYGGYHIVALDQKDYRWSMVIGPDRDYLWILSRDKTLPPAVRTALLEQVRQLGIDPGQLIWVSQQREDG